jgi:hypothetical protein
MLDTALSVAIAVAVILPGFVVADLSRTGRADRTETGDLRLVMRALFYALAIHLMASPWTRWLAERLDGHAEWTNHVNALAAYTVVVLVIAPIVLGLLLNAELRRAEKKGSLRRIHYVLGAHDARTSWDFAFQPFDASTGAFVTVALADGGVVGGMFGDDSWVSRSPTFPHDLFLEEQWALNQDGIPFEPLRPRRGVWISGERVKSVQLHAGGDVK